MDPGTPSPPPPTDSLSTQTRSPGILDARPLSSSTNTLTSKDNLIVDAGAVRGSHIHLKRKGIASTKPKQSKSRDGCTTCKKKRLKCDEAKPLCIQCQKRGVECEGYKKDLKWKSFKEVDFIENGGIAGNQQRARTKRRSIAPQNFIGRKHWLNFADTIAVPTPHVDMVVDSSSSSSLERTHATMITGENESFEPCRIHDFTQDVDSSLNSTDYGHDTFPGQQPLSMHFEIRSPPSYTKNTSRPAIQPNAITSSLESMFTDLDNHYATDTAQGLSPSLFDMLMSSNDLISSVADPFTMLNQHDFDLDAIPDIEFEDTTSDSHGSLPTTNAIHASPRRHSSPNAVVRSSSNTFDDLDISSDDSNMLVARFMQQTCGILSVKDGPAENPWRTIIWPMARGDPSLFHAVVSMAAFHGIQEKPQLHAKGVKHLQESIRLLQSDIMTIDRETALATTIVLAFAVSWNKDITTGINFLHGARILMYKALARHKQQPRRGADLARLKFLCNTWVYIDVISRITAVDDDISTDFDQALKEFYEPLDAQFSEVDPLMGCASKLFPLVGRVANLCRKVCAMESNSIAIISEANDLKEQIQRWQPDTYFRNPRDQTSVVGHAIQTAEAYRHATLLYLHQAVPELPSLTTSQLAEKVLMKLATIPPSSRLLIVHIYPLFVAGCEAKTLEDRNWVETRWLAMRQRMKIGNVESCWHVTQEVWKRRDAYIHKMEEEAEMRHSETIHPPMMATMSLDNVAAKPSANEAFCRQMAIDDYPTYQELLPGIGQVRYRKPRFRAGHSRKKDVEIIENMDPELTVRGRLHWIDVLMDWNWEVLLG